MQLFYDEQQPTLLFLLLVLSLLGPIVLHSHQPHFQQQQQQAFVLVINL